MSRQDAEPTVTRSFILKNLRTIIKLKRANRQRIEKFIDNTRRLEKPVIPSASFEGTGGPMEEGMIYLMFASKDSASLDIDTVYRVFWVNAPNIYYSVIDAFLVSEKFRPGVWEKAYPHGIFKNLSNHRP
ncbi:MAG: hypothetical protein ACFFD4_32945 [Candidatus Odinarchaeota archaeon]